MGMEIRFENSKNVENDSKKQKKTSKVSEELPITSSNTSFTSENSQVAVLESCSNLTHNTVSEESSSFSDSNERYHNHEANCFYFRSNYKYELIENITMTSTTNESNCDCSKKIKSTNNNESVNNASESCSDKIVTNQNDNSEGKQILPKTEEITAQKIVDSNQENEVSQEKTIKENDCIKTEQVPISDNEEEKLESTKQPVEETEEASIKDDIDPAIEIIDKFSTTRKVIDIDSNEDGWMDYQLSKLAEKEKQEILDDRIDFIIRASHEFPTIKHHYRKFEDSHMIIRKEAERERNLLKIEDFIRKPQLTDPFLKESVNCLYEYNDFFFAKRKIKECLERE